MTFGFESTTDEVLQGIDLTGRTVVVTGATSGLGLETARALASKGADVTITGRSQDKLDGAVTQLKDAGVSGIISTAVLELGDLESVRSCAKELLATLDRIDVLVNNAGVMVCPLGRTAQGSKRSSARITSGTSSSPGFSLPFWSLPRRVGSSTWHHPDTDSPTSTSMIPTGHRWHGVLTGRRGPSRRCRPSVRSGQRRGDRSCGGLG